MYSYKVEGFNPRFETRDEAAQYRQGKRDTASSVTLKLLIRGCRIRKFKMPATHRLIGGHAEPLVNAEQWS